MNGVATPKSPLSFRTVADFQAHVTVKRRLAVRVLLGTLQVLWSAEPQWTGNRPTVGCKATVGSCTCQRAIQRIEIGLHTHNHLNRNCAAPSRPRSRTGWILPPRTGMRRGAASPSRPVRHSWPR